MGRCPLCGGNVVKTCKGYRCEHNIGEQPSCVLNINAIIGNRKMEDDEISELLEKRFILLDGFATKEGKTFPTVLELADDGAINMQAVIAKCPHCGGDIRVGSRAFNCSNYGNQEVPCNCSIWRNIGGHQVTLAEVKEICEKSITTSELEMYREDGSIYRKRLGLSPDKLQIIIVLAGGIATLLLKDKSNPKDRAKEVAEKALLASVDRPETVKIHAVSTPDSVFGRDYITQEEKMAISVAMMKVNEKVMKETDGFENMDFEDKAMSSLMERQMSVMSVIRNLVFTESPDDQKPFSSWKVKIEYEAESTDGNPYRSEYWFILDKEAVCVVKSFEIPLL